LGRGLDEKRRTPPCLPSGRFDRSAQSVRIRAQCATYARTAFDSIRRSPEQNPASQHPTHGPPEWIYLCRPAALLLCSGRTICTFSRSGPQPPCPTSLQALDLPIKFGSVLGSGFCHLYPCHGGSWGAHKQMCNIL